MSKKKETNKRYRPTTKDLKEALVTATREKMDWQAECQKLRMELDNKSIQYNLQSTTPVNTVVTKFLSDAPKRRITSTYDLQDFVGELFTKGIQIIGKKNRDYGDHKNNDPFGNFRRHDLKGFLVRIDDKLARLNTFADSGKLAVLDESVLDSITDACNYLGIMAAYIYSEKQRESRISNTAGISMVEEMRKDLRG